MTPPAARTPPLSDPSVPPAASVQTAPPLPPRAPARPRFDPLADPLADYRVAFDLAPVALVLSRDRLMVDCNQAVLDTFGAAREQLVGRSFEVLYPSPDEFERTGQRIVARLDARGGYADERVMKRVGGARAGELFWCRVVGRALDARRPHAAGIWRFDDLSTRRTVNEALTPREREVAALLIEGLTSKQMGRRLDISPRTVEVYRARLMKKYGAATTPELVKRLMSP